MTEKNYGGTNSFGFKEKTSKFKVSSASKSIITKIKKHDELLEDLEISAEIKHSYLKAGKIAKEVREYIRNFVKKDMLLVEIAEKIENKIETLGGKLAFPINLSIDEIAAHYTPIVDDKNVASGLLKVDFGVEVEGYIADTALSFDLTEDKRYLEMIRFNDFILQDTLKRLEVGSELKIIGNNISELVERNGKYKIIKNLTGHSLEKDEVHAGLSVSNTRNENSTELLDVAIAIEPFLTEGKGEIYEGNPSDIFMLQDADKMPRDRDARKLLEFIKEKYRTKPFCKRWLVKAGLQKVNIAMSFLVRDKIIYNFPILIEKEKKPVSQSEHSVLFADKVYVYTD